MEEVLSNVKVVIVGNPSVGKTSLRRTYIGEKFRSNYIETIGSDFSFKTVDIDDRVIGLAIWDLAGQERFLNVHPLFYKGSYGCVVVYSVVDRNTFDQVPRWIERFQKESNRKYLPIMLIGNKIDRLDEDCDKISIEEHNQMLNQIKEDYPNHHVSGIRTSAMTGENVNEGLNEFAGHVLNWIESRSGTADEGDSYEDDIDKNIPGAYALVMNQITGPQVLAAIPRPSTSNFSLMDLSNSSIKLIASLDFNDVIAQSSIISSYPWIKPKGLFHYIAFVIDNANARGNNELFVIGVNVNRELSDPISGIKGVLNGFLYNVVNEFARLYIEHEKDLVTGKFDPDDHLTFISKVEEILEDLRKNTHESLKRWYNIPS